MVMDQLPVDVLPGSLVLAPGCHGVSSRFLPAQSRLTASMAQQSLPCMLMLAAVSLSCKVLLLFFVAMVRQRCSMPALLKLILFSICSGEIDIDMLHSPVSGVPASAVSGEQAVH